MLEVGKITAKECKENIHTRRLEFKAFCLYKFLIQKALLLFEIRSIYSSLSKGIFCNKEFAYELGGAIFTLRL